MSGGNNDVEVWWRWCIEQVWPSVWWGCGGYYEVEVCVGWCVGGGDLHRTFLNPLNAPQCLSCKQFVGSVEVRLSSLPS